MTPDELLSRSRALLLDFDGPICSVFSGIPAHVVADQLRSVLADSGHTDLPPDVAASEDPFEVFRYAATLGEAEARHVEAAFTAHEVEAITTAEPTPGAVDLMKTWHSSGRLLAVVSNNSRLAIDAFLELYGLRRRISCIAARSNNNAKLLKPAPYLLHQAMSRMQVYPAECVFIGDSLTDVEAARAAQIPFVGYANKPGKRERLIRAGAVLTTERITNIFA